MIVCKFGGRATTNKDGIKNIKRVSKKCGRKVLVFSAIGKSEDDDEKLTDLLIEYYEKQKQSNDILLKIKKKIETLQVLTGVKIDLEYYLNKIKRSKDKNYMVSRGEFLTTKIMSKYLGIKFVPAEDVICFYRGKLDLNKTRERLIKYTGIYKNFCTCGFYGKDLFNNKIVLFDRGGGDTSGAIIAKLLGAKVYENYSDVSGVKEVSPNIINDAKTIKKICYGDMLILSQYGGNVLHKSVSEILKNTKIKTKIINIFKLNDKKTIVCQKCGFAQFIGHKKYNNKIKIIIKTKNKNIKKLKNICQNKYFYYFFADGNNYENKIIEIYNFLFKRG